MLKTSLFAILFWGLMQVSQGQAAPVEGFEDCDWEIQNADTETLWRVCTEALDSGQLDEWNTSLAHAGRGIAFARAGNLAGALGDLDQAIKLNPAFLEFFYMKANILVAAKEMDGAYETLRLSIDFSNELIMDQFSVDTTTPVALSNRNYFLKTYVQGAIRNADYASRICFDVKNFACAFENKYRVLVMNTGRLESWLELAGFLVEANERETAMKILDYVIGNEIFSPDAAFTQTGLKMDFYIHFDDNWEVFGSSQMEERYGPNVIYPGGNEGKVMALKFKADLQGRMSDFGGAFSTLERLVSLSDDKKEARSFRVDFISKIPNRTPELLQRGVDDLNYLVQNTYEDDRESKLLRARSLYRRAEFFMLQGNRTMALRDVKDLMDNNYYNQSKNDETIFYETDLKYLRAFVNWRTGDLNSAIADLEPMADTGLVIREYTDISKRKIQATLVNIYLEAGSPSKTHIPLQSLAGYFGRAVNSGDSDSKDFVPNLNSVLWFIATHENDAIRRLSESIYADTLVKGADNNPSYIDTAAAVYAATGNFAKAAELQQQAILQLQDPLSAENQGYHDRLALYRTSRVHIEDNNTLTINF